VTSATFLVNEELACIILASFLQLHELI
jgi:hypothetical protein